MDMELSTRFDAEPGVLSISNMRLGLIVRTRMIHIHSLVIRYVEDAVVRAASEHVNGIVVLLLNILQYR